MRGATRATSRIDVGAARLEHRAKLRAFPGARRRQLGERVVDEA